MFSLTEQLRRAILEFSGGTPVQVAERMGRPVMQYEVVASMHNSNEASDTVIVSGTDQCYGDDVRVYLSV